MSIGEKINNLKLTSLNYYAFLLHLISRIVLAGVLYGTVKEINFDTNLYGYKIKNITGGGKDFTFVYGPPEGPELEMSADALKGIIVAIFLITAFFHLFYWKSKNYIKEVNSGKNRYRWVEYAITASLMIYIYSILSGVKDYYIVFLIVLFNIVLMSFGYFLEMSSNLQAKFMALVMGFFILTIIFSFTYYQFVNNIDAAKDTYDIPNWVYAIVLAMIFWWLSFGVIGVLYYKASLKGKVNFARYEKYYIFLSYISKAFMGYYLAFGLTRKDPEEK